MSSKFKKLISVLCLSSFIATIPANVFSAQFTYTIKSGDSLWSIANNYGTTITKLMQHNSLTSSNNIYVGEPLIINTSAYYTVKSGDSLYSISKKFNVSINDIIDFNHLVNTTLFVGQSLRIVPEDVVCNLDTSKPYIGNQLLTLKTNTPNTVIYYTTDGTVPSTSNGTLYNGSILVSRPSQFRAVAVKNTSVSDVSTFNVNVITQAPPLAPTSSLSQSVAYIGMQQVSLINNTVGACIHYTVDGSMPNENSTLYTGIPIKLDKNTKINAIAYKDGVASNLASFSYNIQKTPDPIIYTSTTTKTVSSSGQYVSMGSTYNNSTFYYTTDGSVPSKSNGIAYTGGFYVGKNYIGQLSLKAISYDMNLGIEGIPSNIVERKFDFIPNQSSFSLPSTNSDGTQKVYTSVQSLVLSSADSGDIYYTTDGSVPTIGAPNTLKYSAPITLDKNTTVSSIVYKNGEQSNIATSSYIINIPPQTINAPATNIGTKAEVAQNTVLYLSTNDQNAAIYYTIDGSNPDSTKLKYNPSLGIKLDHSYVIKAVAINGTQKSVISTNFYAIDEMTGFTMKSQTSSYDIFYGMPYTLNYIFSRYGTLPSEVLANNTWISQSIGLNDSLYNLYGTRWVTIPVRRYKVNIGDSLHSIAALGGYSVDDLVKVNNMKSDTLYVGQYIFLPKLNYTTNSWNYDNLSTAKISNAPSIMLPPTWVTSDPRYNQSHGLSQYDEDMYWLKQIIEAESGGEPLSGQQAVGIVIMNRLALKRAQYIGRNISVKDIVFEYSRNNDIDMYPSNQFVPVINNRIYIDTIGPTIASAADYAYTKNLSVIYNTITYDLSQALFFINPQLVSNSWFDNYCTLVAAINNHNFYSQNGTTVPH